MYLSIDPTNITMLLLPLDGEKKMELITGLSKTLGEPIGEMLVSSRLKWELVVSVVIVVCTLVL